MKDIKTDQFQRKLSAYYAQPHNQFWIVCQNLQDIFLILQGGTIVNDDNMEVGDVVIEDGKIVQVGEDLEVPSGAKIIDATDKFVMPGGVDMATNFKVCSRKLQSIKAVMNIINMIFRGSNDFQKGIISLKS